MYRLFAHIIPAALLPERRLINRASTAERFPRFQAGSKTALQRAALCPLIGGLYLGGNLEWLKL